MAVFAGPVTFVDLVQLVSFAQLQRAYMNNKMKVSRAQAAFYRNKQAVSCSTGKPIPRNSNVVIKTNKLPVHQPFGYGNRAGALDTA